MKHLGVHRRAIDWDARTSDALKELAPDAPGQLYNLKTDPGETTNLYFKHPEIVKELKAKLDHFMASGRSRPAKT